MVHATRLLWVQLLCYSILPTYIGFDSLSYSELHNVKADKGIDSTSHLKKHQFIAPS